MDAATPLPRPDEASTRALLTRLWREHLRQHRGRLLLVLLLTAVMAGTTALYPVVIDRAFSMFTARDRRILYQLPATVLAVTSVKAAAQYLQAVQVQQVVLLVIRALQERMFGHLVRADLARLEREAPAQLAARFTTDATVIREALTRAVNGIADAITLVGLVASMLYLDWLLSLIAAALYPLAAVPIQRIGKRIRRASGGMQERMGETAALLNESFAQARSVRAYRLEGIEERRAHAAFDGLYRALLRMTRSRARVDPVLEVLGGAAVAAVIGFAGWRAAVGQQHHRQLHRVRGRPADRFPPAAGARVFERRGARRVGRPGPRVRGRRRAAHNPRNAGGARVAERARPAEFPRRQLRLPRRPRRPRRAELHGGTGNHGGLSGAVWSRQIDCARLDPSPA